MLNLNLIYEKETSEKNRARGKMNTSKYRGGRQGYQHFEEEIVSNYESCLFTENYNL